ncbi:hypothetical protein TrVE_jg4420 [Triparma verrucosa]|uniref:Uncharacterized protein n=1 Tax=Triparma verrucosa TaxID=1606542 RepID=A0A9W7B8G2_9STRA|nr:hypothetical protein TrVE_jg4420 [Triparma verrucosa]
MRSRPESLAALLIFIAVARSIQAFALTGSAGPAGRQHTRPRSTVLSADGSDGSLFGGLFNSLSSAFEADKTLKPDGLEGRQPKAKAKPSYTSAQIPAANLEGTSWEVQWFLTGVAERDFSSDLYGSRIDISNAKVFDQTLMAMLPDEPQVRSVIKFKEGGKCACEVGDFTTGQDGEWKIVYEGGKNRLRFSVSNLGFRKVTSTQGSLQNVFGGVDNSETKSTRSIPEGKVYCDLEVTFGGDVGTLSMLAKGLVRAEVEFGLLKAGRLLPCGRVDLTCYDENECAVEL